MTEEQKSVIERVRGLLASPDLDTGVCLRIQPMIDNLVAGYLLEDPKFNATKFINACFY